MIVIVIELKAKAFYRVVSLTEPLQRLHLPHTMRDTFFFFRLLKLDKGPNYPFVCWGDTGQKSWGATGLSLAMCPVFISHHVSFYLLTN